MKQIVVLGVVVGVLAGVIGGVLGSRRLTDPVLAASPERMSVQEGCTAVASVARTLRASVWRLADDARARRQARTALEQTEATLEAMGWTTPAGNARDLRLSISGGTARPDSARRLALHMAEFNIRLLDQCRDARARDR